MRIISYIVVVFILLTTFGCNSENQSMDLDSAVRGDEDPKFWEIFDDSLKFDLCLNYKVYNMRRVVAEISDPVALINYYPIWLDGLEDCDKIYKIDHNQAEILRERVGTEMAEAIGEIVVSYLQIQALYSGHREESYWVDMWRAEAKFRVSKVGNVLFK